MYLCLMWIYKGFEINSLENVPEGAFGFIYQLTCTGNCEHLGKKYIGKKQIHSVRKKNLTQKEILLLPNKRSKRWKMVTSESDWLTYNSSCDLVKKLIKEGVEFKREILEFSYSKTQNTYLEARALFKNDVLESEEWFNENILQKFFKGKV